jgi:ribosomal protein L40E
MWARGAQHGFSTVSLVNKGEPAANGGRISFPAFGCSGSDFERVQEAKRELDSPHLMPCVRCGAQNGRSASVCWNCEAILSEAPPLRAAAVVRTAPPAQEHRESSAGKSSEPSGDSGFGAAPSRPLATRPGAIPQATLPVLTSEVSFPGPASLSLPTGSGVSLRAMGFASTIFGVALLGAGAFLFFRPTPPVVVLENSTPASAASTASMSRAAPVSPPVSTSPEAEPVEPVRSEDSPVVADEVASAPTPSEIAKPISATRSERRLVRAPRVPGVSTPRPAQPLPTAPTTDSQAAADALFAPSRSASRAAPGVTPSVAPCTPTVAALGLCTRPSTQPKE